MPAVAAMLQRFRSLSIGQLTFGSFLLLLAVITATSMASVIAMRHLDTTFAELQRLQDVGDLAEDIERRMSDLRLAAREFVTDPTARPGFEAAIAEVPDRSAARTVFRAQNEISQALLAHDPPAAVLAAEQMRALTIDDPGLRAATNAYADAVIAISGTEGEIAKLDKEVLGTEGRLIGRVTELLRELSARRGRVLSHDFARTLAETKWQSIILGTLGVLIGIYAAIFVVRRTVR